MLGAGDSVVRVLGTACGLGVEGSGWAVRPGLVVTNAHVIAGSEDTTVTTQGGVELDATPVYYGPEDDLALLRVGANLPTLPISDQRESGSGAAVLGYPENGPYAVTPARLGETRATISEDSYGNGPIERTIVALRGAGAQRQLRRSPGRRPGRGRRHGLRRHHLGPAGRVRDSGRGHSRSPRAGLRPGCHRRLHRLSRPPAPKAHHLRSVSSLVVEPVISTQVLAGPPGSVCPHFHAAIELIGKRWTGAIVCALTERPMRFGELGKAVPGLSDRLLSQRLRELEDEGLVEREVEAGSPGAGHLLADRDRRGAGAGDRRAAGLGEALEAHRVTRVAGAYRRPRSLACGARHAPCVLDLLGLARHS